MVPVSVFMDAKKSKELYPALKFNPVSKVHDFQNYPWVESALSHIKKGQGYQDPVMTRAMKDEICRWLQLYYPKRISSRRWITAG